MEILELLKDQETNATLITNYKSTMLKAPKERRTISWYKTKLDNLELLWKDFLNGHRVLSRSMNQIAEDPYIVNDVFSETSNNYTAVKSDIMDQLIPGRRQSSIQADTHYADVKFETPNYKTPLPSMELPRFSDNQLEWETFKGMFIALVHDVPTFPPILKLQYLIRSLTGEAANRLKNVQITAENYEPSWKAITDRYDNKKVLLASHMSHIVSTTPMQKRSVEELRRVLDAISESRQALENLEIRPEKMGDLWLIHHTVQKLDHGTRLDWERQTDSGEDFPAFTELSNFLERSIRVFEAANPSAAISTSDNGQNRYAKSAPIKSKQVSAHATSTQAARKVNSRVCSMCRGNHMLYACGRFLDLTQPQRFEFCKKERLCINCLMGGHFARECRSDRRCLVCQARHHTKLHTETQALRREASMERVDDRNAALDDRENHVAVHFAKQAKIAESKDGRSILLATAQVLLLDAHGNEVKVRSLIDPGSERSFITERIMSALSINIKRVSLAVKVMGGSQSALVRKEAHVIMRSESDPEFTRDFSALVMRELTGLLPKTRVNKAPWTHARDLPLADPKCLEPGRVDCVIGADLYPSILLEGVRIGSVGTPVAQRTVFGWILTGDVNPEESTIAPRTGTFHVESEPTLDQRVEKFWEIETIPAKKHLTDDEAFCEKYFMETTTRTPSGRFMVRLPFAKKLEFAGMRDIAVACLTRAEQRMAKSPRLAKLYTAFMDEYSRLGHMELVSMADQSRDSYYLPHHAVFRPEKPDKIRVVFNASQKAVNRVSLNDVLLPGPKLQKDITAVITRWRFFRHVFVTDIVKMFRQILVHPDDVDWQRIVWRSDAKGMIRDYRALTVTYGTAPAPFLALRVLQQLAADGREDFPEAARLLDHQVYVDDIFGGGDDIGGTIKRRDQLLDLMKTAGMELGKWSANDKFLLRGVPNRVTEEIPVDLNDVVSTLGLRWGTKRDEFLFEMSSPPEASSITKRVVLSNIAKLFDPLGWLAPVTIVAKILLQDLWLEKIDWDVQLQGELLHRWRQFCAALLAILRIRVPRWFGGNEETTWSMHGFADASKRAYAAAIYMVIPGCSSHLIMAKTKMAPTKVESLPRLELCAATLLVRLASHLLSSLCRQPEEIHFWSDSRVVLDWLKSHPSRWQTFVANRVSEIINTFPRAEWHHVRSEHNAVDCATRGLTAEQLCNMTLWWNGPSWITSHHTLWPDMAREKEPEKTEIESFYANEERREMLVEDDGIRKIFKKFSSYAKILRILAYCGHWLHKLKARRAREHQVEACLAVEDYDWARVACYRLVQGSSFAGELKCLRAKKKFAKKSSLARLQVVVDRQGLIRLDGRLRNAPLPYDERHPVILPSSSSIVKRLVEHAHIDTKHGGVQLMLSYLQRSLWIINVRRLVEQVFRDCVKCARFRAQTDQQQMAPLPVERITPRRPFSATGLDYADPIPVLFSRGRGAKSTKGYIAIFVCLVVKAVHIEIVSDLTAEAFLAAYARFTARRGACDLLYSDNATTFKRASSVLTRMFEEASSFRESVYSELAASGTEWKFIPPRAPHFGGLWEAAVKSFKYHLRRVIGDSKLTFEELSTLAAKIEACLNSRPLCRISSNPDDLVALTPGHFLVGTAYLSPLEKFDTCDKRSLRDRWQLLNQLRNSFWARWRSEVLSQLQTRNKWLEPQVNIEVGQLVIIKDELSPPARWPLGVVTEVKPGADGLVRVTTVRTASSTYSRPVVKLIRLPDDVRASEEFCRMNEQGL